MDVKAAGDNQSTAKELDQPLKDLEKAKEEVLCMTIDASGDGKIIGPSSSPDTSSNDNDNSSVSVKSSSRKYLSIAQIVTNMKARWEVFAMENEIARCKRREQKEQQEKYANLARGKKIENIASKSPSAPHLSTSSGLLNKESPKSLVQEDSIRFNSDLTNVLSAEDIQFCKNDNDNAYKSLTSCNDFERDSTEWKTADFTEPGGSDKNSDKNCYTAEEKSSNDSSLSSGSPKVSKQCGCSTHIMSPREKSPRDDESIADKDFSFGQTYTIADTDGSCKSCSQHTSSSFEAESANHPNDPGTTHNKSLRAASNSSSHSKLEELCRDYDSVILARNEPIVWNIRTSSTQINQCYNNFRKENPEEKICSNVSPNSESIYSLYQKVCKKCARGIFPGQAKFENPLDKNLAWHKNCFRCMEINCQKELHNFDHILYNGEPFCYQHYIEKSKASRCKSCYEFIADETYTYALGEFWHQGHFTCGYCRNALINSEFITVDKNVICLPCHATLFKKNCQSCGKLIEIHQQFVHSGELFWHSNDSCMQCETCSNSLIGRVRFYRKDGHLYCNRFCSQQRGPP